MYMRLLWVLALVCMPAAAQAQEHLLPSRSQFFASFDGLDAHRQAYDKTALGKLMQGDMGLMCKEVSRFAMEIAKNSPQSDFDPEELLRHLHLAISTVTQKGYLLAIEVEEVNPPKATAVLVLRGAGGEKGEILPLIQKSMATSKVPMTTSKVGTRDVTSINAKVAQFGWWSEGQHAILFAGTGSPEAYAQDIDAKKTGLANHKLYQKVKAFAEYPTCSHSFLDLAAVLELAGRAHPQVNPVIDQLGLKSLQSLIGVSGFDGPAERATLELSTDGKRTGLLGLASTKKFGLKNLPQMPADITGFSAGSIDVAQAYDALINSAHGVAKIFASEEADQAKEMLKKFEESVGVDLKRDLFESFGELSVGYSSPSEGVLGTGSVMALQVKDGAKLTRTLNTLIKAIPENPFVELSLKKTPYKGGELFQVISKGQVQSTMACFGIHKGWFIYAAYPQPIKGFIMRQNGELAAWKATDELNRILGTMPQEFSAISVSDPRPTFKTVVALLPLLAEFGNGMVSVLVPDVTPFDVNVIPHAEEAALQLFPNVTISTEEAGKLRTNSRVSIGLP